MTSRRSRERARAARAAERRGGRDNGAPVEPVAPSPSPNARSSPANAPEPATALAEDLIDRWFVPIALGIILVAAAIRLPELALNPFHHDEGVNGFFTKNLVRDGSYHYDPQNYHGPSLYYLALIAEILLGLTTEAMRLVPVLFGIGVIALIFPLRRYLGSVAVLSAALLLSVSPAMVYVSRYFIHEMLVVAFTLGLIVSVVFYLDRREAKYLIAASASAALLFTTKETSIVTVGVLLIAVLVANVYLRLRAGESVRSTAGRRVALARQAPANESVWIDGVEYRRARPARDELGRGGQPERPEPFDLTNEQWVGAAVVFIVIYVLLFTSFFTNFPQGLVDSFTGFLVWLQRGEQTQVQPIYKYLEWMVPLDVAILALGAVGGLIAAIRIPSRLWVIVGLWALGITAAYSIPQYKTPWIVVNMLLPLALLAGLVVSTLWRSKQPIRFLAPVLLAAGVAVNAGQAIDLNYIHYDDEAYKYPYVHSTRDMLRLVDEIEAVGARAGTGEQTGVSIVSPDYWPLPWYLRDDPNAAFWGQIVDNLDQPMILANVNQRDTLAPTIGATFTEVGTFNLRPGVDLVLYVRNDVPTG